MKLWLLTRRSDKPTYDVANGFVVRAPDEATARELCARDAGDEGPDRWRGDWGSTCEELTATGEPEVVLRDFNAA